MTSTRLAPAFLFCKCGHTGRRHEVVDGGEHEGACTAGGCPCSSFAENGDPVARTDDGLAAGGPMPDTIRGVELEGPPERVYPRTPPAVIAPKAPVANSGARPSMLSRAAASKNSSTVRLGERIEQMLADLAGILDHEDKSSVTRARLAELDTERRRLLDELGEPEPKPKKPRNTTPVDCACGRPFPSIQAFSSHRRSALAKDDDTHVPVPRRAAPAEADG